MQQYNQIVTATGKRRRRSYTLPHTQRDRRTDSIGRNGALTGARGLPSRPRTANAMHCKLWTVLLRAHLLAFPLASGQVAKAVRHRGNVLKWEQVSGAVQSIVDKTGSVWIDRQTLNLLRFPENDCREL